MFCMYIGLDVDNDRILEMACIITDGDLKLVAEVCMFNVHVKVSVE